MNMLQRKKANLRGYSTLPSSLSVLPATTRVLFLVAIVLLTGCPARKSQSSGKNQVILRMHGSNTIGAQLAPALAEAFLRARGANDVKTITRGPEEVLVQGVFSDSSIRSIEIAAHGSATAFVDLKNNKCDIGNASRQIKPDEVASLSSLGDMLSPASERVLGLDGIAIVVNVSNPVASLSTDQLQAIFDGELSDWSQLGRSIPDPVNVYARDEKSGTWDTFKTIVLKSHPLTPAAKRFEDSAKLSDSVSNDPNGIGFIGLPYVRNAKPIAVSDGRTQPILPTRLTIATEDYPLSRRLYIYTASNPQNDAVRAFANFAISPAGQAIVAQNGFVEQTAKPILQTEQQQQIPPDAPPNYRRLIVGGARLPLDFRFRSGSATLDNKAFYDLGRVLEFVSSSQYTGQKILLLGFADSRGTRKMNCLLSQQRAQIVANEFGSRGIKTSTVSGFCDDLPVASNETSEGREKNRRVEVWLNR